MSKTTSAWTLRIDGTAAVGIEVSISRSGNVATVVLTDLQNPDRRSVSEHPVFVERAAYTKRIIFVTVGGSADPGFNGHARTVIGAAEDFASKRAAEFGRVVARKAAQA